MQDQSTPRTTADATSETDSRYPARPCAHCGTPFSSRDKRQRFCSRPCVWAAARAKLAGMQAEGEDPTHGGKAAEARRASLARRRAAGELLGRAAHNAKKAGTLPERPFTPPPLSQDEIGAAWQDAGEVWDAFTQKALQRDRGQTLIVAGHGAGLFVDHDALIVKEGLTHYPQTPARHVLYRGVHGVERIILLAPSGSLSFDAIRWCQEHYLSLRNPAIYPCAAASTWLAPRGGTWPWPNGWSGARYRG